MKLIKLSEDHYVIVDDSEIKDVRPYIDMYHLEDGNTINKFPTYLTDLSSCKLITHSTQPLEYSYNSTTGGFNMKQMSSDVELIYDIVQPLSLSEVKELIGEVDVENKAIEWYNGESKYNSNYVADPYSWKEGYNQALEDSKDKKYTEEDMRIAIRLATTSKYDHVLAFYPEDEILKVIQHKTSWDVEVVDGKLKLK